MKSYTSVLVFLAATASLVASAPNPVMTPAPMLRRQNAAGNGGSKGIAAADLAQEAVDLANAGDIGAQTNAAQFDKINAAATAKEAADVKTAADVVATQAAAAKATAAAKAGNDAKAAAAKEKGKGKGKGKGKKAAAAKAN